MRLSLPSNPGRTLAPRGMRALAFLAAALAAAPAVRADPGPGLGLPLAASPESEGFSPVRLERVGALLGKVVAEGKYAGAVWVVARDGHIVSHGAVGYSDVAAHRPMTDQTVFAIMSMTKIITTVTALSLWEEGRFNMDDPVENYLPQLANLKIYASGPVEAPVLVPATRKPTIRNLLTQTSGFTYGFFPSDPAPVRAIYAKANLFAATSLPEFLNRAATVPLLFEPGHTWNYGINTDLIGALIEKISGQPFEAAMRERVLGPLGMTDTGFSPPADGSRLAKLYVLDANGHLVEATLAQRPPVPQFSSGGGGLYSTAHDYARFAQMLLNGGELEGKRILGRKTVDYMTSDQLGNLEVKEKGRYFPAGFGLGVRVRVDNAADYETLGSPGEYGWEGILSTYISINPKERVFTLLMTQEQPYDAGFLFESFANSTYQALEK